VLEKQRDSVLTVKMLSQFLTLNQRY